MACPNFKKGLKMVSGPLGVNDLKLGTNLDRLMLQSLLKTIGPTKKKQKITMLIEILTFM
jgi:hypothetical protein